MRLPVLFALLVTLTECHSTILSVIEGEKVKFEFPYPCESARVTLQKSNRIPFYDSAKAEPISLPSEWLHRFDIQDIIKDGNCSLHLTINPAESIDIGTYISFTYSHDGTAVIDRIGLNVDTLPGEVSCTLNQYIENWVELQCVAPVGSLSGEIQCYQNGERMPPLTEHIETTEHLRGSILVKNTNPVFCCTAAWRVRKDICECKDFYLRFVDTLPVIGEDAAFIDPCVTMTTSSAVALTNKEEKDAMTFEPNLNITSRGTGRNDGYDGKRECDGVYHSRRDIISSTVCTFIGVFVIVVVIGSIRWGLRKWRKDRSGDFEDYRSGVKMESRPYVTNGDTVHHENDVDGEPPASLA